MVRLGGLPPVDDLDGVVETNIKTRSKEAAKAEEIVVGEVGQFLDWMRSRESFPTIVALREWAEEVRRTEWHQIVNMSGTFISTTYLRRVLN